MTTPGGTGEGALLVRREGPVLHLTLSNPGRRNAISWAMYEALLEACTAARSDPDLRVVVLRGAGDAFAAGTEVQLLAEFTDGQDGVAYERRVAQVLGALLDLPMPVVGVVTGPAVGAGMALAACCDVLVATTTARFGVPIARTLGNCVPAAVVARLQQRLGVARTMAMLLTARLMDAAEAGTAGLVHTVVEPDGLEDAVTSLVERLTSCAPLTLAAVKEMDRRLHAAQQVADADLLERCYGSEDFREGVSAFLDHRAPVWEGR